MKKVLPAIGAIVVAACTVQNPVGVAPAFDASQVSHRPTVGNYVLVIDPGGARLSRTVRASGLSCLWDTYPVSPGHALLVPHRHIPRWFDATAEEQAELTSAIEQARVAIEKRFSPQGYNIGFNDQKAAGQSVPHLHIHVIPRYEGDVDFPRGGIRTIIPARAAYWKDKQ